MALTAVWHSNAPYASTGYGTQTAQVLKRMAADGHRMAVAANYGVEATIFDWHGIPVYPRGLDAYNNDIVGPYFDDWSAQHPGPACQFTLFDVWVYNSPRFDDIPTVSWVPVDHIPVPPGVTEFLKKPTIEPIAMSAFGHQMLTEAGIDSVCIPHGIETSIFKPTARVTIADRHMTGREIMGDVGEDRYVVGCFNANKGINPSRKSWAENLLAFSIFAKDKPEALLYLHTERDGAMGGVKLTEIITSLGLREDQYRFVNQYAYRMGIPQEALAALYTATDVGLMVSMGEGFGLTAAEMQACERPVILSDFSAQTELLGDGWLVKGQPWWDAAQHAWFNQPIVGNIIEALEAAYARGRGMSAKARKHIVEHFDADRLYETRWRPFLADYEARLLEVK